MFFLFSFKLSRHGPVFTTKNTLFTSLWIPIFIHHDIGVEIAFLASPFNVNTLTRTFLFHAIGKTLEYFIFSYVPGSCCSFSCCLVVFWIGYVSFWLNEMEWTFSFARIYDFENLSNEKLMNIFQKDVVRYILAK